MRAEFDGGATSEYLRDASIQRRKNCESYDSENIDLFTALFPFSFSSANNKSRQSTFRVRPLDIFLDICADMVAISLGIYFFLRHNSVNDYSQKTLEVFGYAVLSKMKVSIA